MKTIDEERREFEAEYIAILQPSDGRVESEVLSRFSDGDYKKFATQNSWRLWQAARQSNNVPVAYDKNKIRAEVMLRKSIPFHVCDAIDLTIEVMSKLSASSTQSNQVLEMADVEELKNGYLLMRGALNYLSDKAITINQADEALGSAIPKLVEFEKVRWNFSNWEAYRALITKPESEG